MSEVPLLGRRKRPFRLQGYLAHKKSHAPRSPQGYLLYSKMQLEETHRIRPLRFLNSRKRHRQDPESVFLT